MKYIITENRLVSLVGNMITSAEPHFNKKDAEQFAEEDDGSVMINYYYTDNGKPVLLAKYDTWRRSIRLKRNLYDMIENHFGWPDGVMAVVDWFNAEFNQDADGVGYLGPI